MYMCVYIYIHTYIYIHIHMCIYTHIYLAVQDLTFKLFYVACLLIIVSLMLCMVKLPCNRQRCQASAGARREQNLQG